VKIVLVPSSVSAGVNRQRYALTSYLVNDTVAIDAGSIGLYGSARAQGRIRHVLLTHSHMDHVASLPIFLENVYQMQSTPVTVHGSKDVMRCLRRDLFNGRLWPDFIALSPDATGFLRLETLQEGQPLELEGLRFTPCAVNHVVPTLGFLIEDQEAAVLVVSDTGPTEAIWELANRTPNLKGVFLEASFPDSLAWLADVSKHLTPASFAREVKKLKQAVPLIAVHIKTRYHTEIVAELEALGLPKLEIGAYGRPYYF
jgi:ribonuclease BN (tRNA processing enzyme)